MAMKATLAPFSLLLSTSLFAQAPPTPPLLPVREVTVFKDGHAYVVREMALPADAGGKVVLDELPVPVLGTFWPFAADGARLVSAKAGRERVALDLPAVNLLQVARANVGKDVVVLMNDKERIEGKLLAVPEREPPKKAPEPPPGVFHVQPGPSEPSLLLVQTASGTRALSINNVRDLEVHGEFAAKVREQQDRERLTLTVEGGGGNAKVGVMYVQQGLRWIPSYRVDIDGNGKAVVQMEATLVNDLVDLERATVHCVVGVPQFAFEGLVDPISLQQEIAQVAAQARGSRFDNYVSNSIMTQAAVGFQPQGAERGPGVDGADANEDLFVFTLRDVTLKKDERLVLPLATFDVTYRDAYRLDVPFAPPPDVREGQNSERMIELMRQLAAPKVKHLLRLRNGGKAPLTTAPALVLAKGRMLAQGRITYTPPGAETDLEINAAIDVCVKSGEQESGRQNSALRIAGTDYGRIDLTGTIELHNTKAEAVTVEVARRVLGHVDDVGQGGSKAQLDVVQVWSGADRASWWSSWNWPHWWFRQNGFGEVRWTVELQPGASAKLDASWHYFWR